MGKKALKKIINRSIREDKLEVIRNHPEIAPELRFLEKIDLYVRGKECRASAHCIVIGYCVAYGAGRAYQCK